ncbi:MAG: glycosyltransferase [Gemmatimonadota bacterium]|nr:glycosyltransferase [Gemmatimonadota bacterium]
MNQAWITDYWPWILGPLVMLWRSRGSPSLGDESPDIPAEPTLVSMIIPARNEARNIERCVRSIQRTTWPALELLVVDDRSEDGTGDLVRALAATDARVRVIDGTPVPEGWFGKQWACAQGAREARGSTLIFTDADTAHAPDLVVRTVNAMRARAIDFFTVGGFQELGTFWERAVQPQVFYILAARYGGAGAVNRARRSSDKVANGQYIAFTRAAYDSSGGHEAVKGRAAEDLALGQLVHACGLRSELAMAIDQMSTRMYINLREVVNGWTKNLVMAGREAMPPSPTIRLLAPLLMVIAPLVNIAPIAVLIASAFTELSPSLLMWARVCSASLLVWWIFIYVRAFRLSPLYVLSVPLGAAMTIFIIVRATVRGRSIEWKGRRYRAA